MWVMFKSVVHVCDTAGMPQKSVFVQLCKDRYVLFQESQWYVVTLHVEYEVALSSTLQSLWFVHSQILYQPELTENCNTI